MRHICIVTPGALGSNPRVVKEATALYEAGYQVSVISTRTMPLVDLRDEAICRSIGWKAIRLNFHSAGLGYWYLKACRVLQMLAAACYRLTAARWLADWSYSAFTTPLCATARKLHADLYIAHYVAALPAVASAAKKHHALYAFDAEDFHLGDLPEGSAGEAARRLIQDIEKQYLPGCAHVTAASPGIADAYVEAYDVPRPVAVLNVFPLSQAPDGPTRKGSVKPGPSVYWFSQTIGPDRGLECAVRAIALAKSQPHLYLRGTPAVNHAEELGGLAEEHGVADRLHILPPAEPFEMERLACGYDLGFVGETGFTHNRRIALTNKQFTYLLAGLPAVMSDVPAHKLFSKGLESVVFLYRADHDASLAQTMDALLMDANRLANARAMAHQLGQDRFNWDKEKEILLTTVLHDEVNSDS